MILDDNIVSLIHFNENNKINYDECENIWYIYNPSLCIYDNSCYKFSHASCKIVGYSYLESKSINTYELFSNDFTIDFWINIDKYVFDGGIISCSSGQDYGFSLIINKENQTLEIRLNSDNKIIQFILSQEIKLNKWYHIAFSKNNDYFKFFINGELIKDFRSIKFMGLSNSIILGNYHHINPNSDNFKGHIDEFRIRNTCEYNDNFIPPTSEYYHKRIFYFDTLCLMTVKGKEDQLLDPECYKRKEYIDKHPIIRKIEKTIKIPFNTNKELILGDLKQYGFMKYTKKYQISRKIKKFVKIQYFIINNTVKKIQVRKRIKRKVINSVLFSTRRRIETNKCFFTPHHFVFDLHYKYIGK